MYLDFQASTGVSAQNASPYQLNLKIIEPPHEKTNNVHRRKQSRRSAVQ